MAGPDYEAAVYAASWPQHVDNDSRNYFIFQLLAEGGFAGPVFYRDMVLDGSEHIMQTVAKAYMQKRKLKVFLMDPSHGQMRVQSVELGEST